MEYVDQQDGGYYISGTRVGLDSIVHRFNEGASPESIFRSFPGVGSLEKVYGAITFYLVNKEVVEAYLRDQERLWQESSEKQSPLPDSLTEKLSRVRQEALPR